jgi:hypothetical protein
MSTQLRVGDTVITNHFENDGLIYKPLFSKRMSQFIGKEGIIEEAASNRNWIKVHGYFWPEEALIKVEPLERESEFKPGDEVQMSAYDDYSIKFNLTYLMELPNKWHLGWDKDQARQFKYCRKPLQKKQKWNVVRSQDGYMTVLHHTIHIENGRTIVHSFELDEK